MWTTDYVREVKRQLRDVYGLTPSRVVGGEPCFDRMLDGIYPMTIEGKQDYVVIQQDNLLLGLAMMDPEKTRAGDRLKGG